MSGNSRDRGHIWRQVPCIAIIPPVGNYCAGRPDFLRRRCCFDQVMLVSNLSVAQAFHFDHC